MMDNKDMPAMALSEYQLTEAVTVKGCPPEIKEIKYVKAHGLTKREHFAGLAMQGILSNPVIMARLLEQDDVSVDTLVSSLAEVNAGSLLEALEKDNEL
jgi:hypothetical protein